MNAHEEQRVIQALHLVSARLSVTEQDIAAGAQRFQAALQAPPPRRRAALLAVAAAAIVFLAGLVALDARDRSDERPAPAEGPTTVDGPAEKLRVALEPRPYDVSTTDFRSDPVPTRQQLSGLWLLRQPFGPEGMFVSDEGRWSLLHPQNYQGRYTFEDGVLTRRFTKGFCDEQRESPWETRLAMDGSLRLNYIGVNNVCSPADDREVWDRLAPGDSPLATFLRESVEEIEWSPAGAAQVGNGLYYSPELGHVLEILEDDVVRYYDDIGMLPLVRADEGTLTLQEDGDRTTVTMACRKGSFTSEVQYGRTPLVPRVIPAMVVLRLSPEGSCASGLHRATTWVRIQG